MFFVGRVAAFHLSCKTCHERECGGALFDPDGNGWWMDRTPGPVFDCIEFVGYAVNVVRYINFFVCVIILLRLTE